MLSASEVLLLCLAMLVAYQISQGAVYFSIASYVLTPNLGAFLNQLVASSCLLAIALAKTAVLDRIKNPNVFGHGCV